MLEKGAVHVIKRNPFTIQPKDLVKIEGKWLETTGIHNKGTRLIVNKKSVSIKNVEKVIYSGTLVWRQQFLSALKDRVSLLQI